MDQFLLISVIVFNDDRIGRFNVQVHKNGFHRGFYLKKTAKAIKLLTNKIKTARKTSIDRKKSYIIIINIRS